MAIVTTTITEDLITVAIAQTILNPISFDPSQLGTMAAQDADDVDITGGQVVGLDFIDMTDNPLLNIDYIDFELTNGVFPAEGRLVWNDEDGTLNLGLKGGDVNLQIGQEQVLRGKNVTGVDDTDGRPVRITGISGVNPEFDFPQADIFAKAGALGVFTEDITNLTNGYITTFGLVRGLDTTGAPYGEVWSDNDRLFVSNVSGGLTNVAPSADERIILIGLLLRANANDGVILVNIINTPYLMELSGMSFSGLADMDIIQYDAATNTWVNIHRQIVSGSRGSGAALISLLSALDTMGLIDDQTIA